jgi:hypothetical protein
VQQKLALQPLHLSQRPKEQHHASVPGLSQLQRLEKWTMDNGQWTMVDAAE